MSELTIAAPAEWQDPPMTRRLGRLLARVRRTRGATFGMAVVLLVLLVAVAADFVAPYDPNKSQGAILQPPSMEHFFGTDHLGRDVLSRAIHGTRVAVLAGVVSVGFAILLGVTVGLLAGYWSGWVDDLLMRLVDTLWSFPTLVLALAIAFSLGPGLSNAMVAIGVVFTP
ncbi:MAG: ABC transporter permease, partial [Chloroflexota bacterium]